MNASQIFFFFFFRSNHRHYTQKRTSLQKTAHSSLFLFLFFFPSVEIDKRQFQRENALKRRLNDCKICFGSSQTKKTKKQKKKSLPFYIRWHGERKHSDGNISSIPLSAGIILLTTWVTYMSIGSAFAHASGVIYRDDEGKSSID